MKEELVRLDGITMNMVTEGPHGDCRVTVINICEYKKIGGTAPRNDTGNMNFACSGVIAKVSARFFVTMRDAIRQPANMVTEGPHGDCRVTVINTCEYKKIGGTAPRNDTGNMNFACSGVIAKVGARFFVTMRDTIRQPAAIPKRTFGHHGCSITNSST